MVLTNIIYNNQTNVILKGSIAINVKNLLSPQANGVEALQYNI